MSDTVMTRKEAMEALQHIKTEVEAMGRSDLGDLAGRVAFTLEKNVQTMAQIFGARGGNTPVKPGSRPRGRPRKEK